MLVANMADSAWYGNGDMVFEVGDSMTLIFVLYYQKFEYTAKERLTY